MPGEVLMELAQWAGQTVVAAALTDAWESARHKVARLFGRGDQTRTEAAERWLVKTYERLTAAQDRDLKPVRTEMAKRWEGRFADLLDEDPDIRVGLEALVREIQAQMPAAAVPVASQLVAAGGDLSVSGDVNLADRGGVIAGDVQGSISTNPPPPGSTAA